MGLLSYRAGPRSSGDEPTPAHRLWQEAGFAAHRPVPMGVWGQAATAAGGHQDLARQLWAGGVAGDTAYPNITESRQGCRNPHRAHDGSGSAGDEGMDGLA